MPATSDSILTDFEAQLVAQGLTPEEIAVKLAVYANGVKGNQYLISRDDSEDSFPTYKQGPPDILKP
jgi:hypothetical protein